MSARTLLLDALEVVFEGMPAPKPRLVRGPRATDAPGSKPMIVATTSTYEPLPEAPRSKVRWTGVLTIVSKHVDLIRAEDQLEALYEAVFAGARSSQYSLGEAKLIAYAQNEDGTPAQLALEVQVTSIFNQE